MTGSREKAVIVSCPRDTKRCTECGEVKPVGEFYKNKCAKYGLSCSCKACRAKYRSGKHYKPEVKNVYARVDFNLNKELKLEAKKYGMPVTQLLTGMIYFYFDNYKD